MQTEEICWLIAYPYSTKKSNDCNKIDSKARHCSSTWPAPPARSVKSNETRLSWYVARRQCFILNSGGRIMPSIIIVDGNLSFGTEYVVEDLGTRRCLTLAEKIYRRWHHIASHNWLSCNRRLGNSAKRDMWAVLSVCVALTLHDNGVRLWTGYKFSAYDYK